VALTESLGVFEADFGVPVSFTGSAAGMLGLEDYPGIAILGDGDRAVIAATDRTVLVRTDQLGALARGDAITVNGTARIVRDVLVPDELKDGAFTLVALR